MPNRKRTNEEIDALASRPAMPEGYGLAVSTEGSLIQWSWVEAQMTVSKSYWVGTVGANGRPHIMPVWGMWFEGAFYFGTDAKSRKARNLALSPNIAVHLESGDDAVILEGIAERVTDSGFLERFSDAYKVKYEYRPDLNDPVTATYMLVPRVVFAWRESNFPEAATRWVFPQA
jgi:general stress protein 26